MALFTDRIDTSIKHDFMAEAIKEARKSGLVPTVGAVIVKNGKIISRGHRKTKKYARPLRYGESPMPSRPPCRVPRKICTE